jgi:hypothetical protein
VKTYNFQTRTHFLIYILLLGALGAGSACSLNNLSGSKDISAAPSENQSAKTDAAGISGSSNQSPPEKSDAALDVEGTYRLNNHRNGQEGYENSLIVEKDGKGKIRVSFEGAFFYQANGAETFHDSSAYGTLTIDGNVAKGRLKEEGSDNNCPVELNFAADERVSLKSSGCDLNVTPDGVYQKGASRREDNPDADVVEQNRRQNTDNDDANRPFVQYDQSGEPNGIVNLMERDGERVGCQEEIMTYTGEAIKVDYIGDYVLEFTLASDNRKRQKISLVLASEDRLPFDDVRSIIKRGNHLEVTFIYCGNAPIATPTAIYKR